MKFKIVIIYNYYQHNIFIALIIILLILQLYNYSVYAIIDVKDTWQKKFSY